MKSTQSGFLGLQVQVPVDRKGVLHFAIWTFTTIVFSDIYIVVHKNPLRFLVEQQLEGGLFFYWYLYKVPGSTSTGTSACNK